MPVGPAECLYQRRLENPPVLTAGDATPMVVWIASERYGGSVLDDKAKSLVTRLIRDYYSSATVAPPDIARREFGFGEFDKKISYRHMSFKDVPALARYLVESAPPFVSYSSA